MKTIVFVTTNKGKAGEVKKILKGLRVIITPFELPEDHSLSQEKIAGSKARAAFKLVKKPIIVDDTGFYVRGFKNFPGVKSKEVFKKIGLEGFMKKCGGRKAYALTVAAYYDGKKMHLFKGTCKGNIPKAASEKMNPNLPYWSCFVPLGSKLVVADFSRKDVHNFLSKESHRAKAFKKFKKWFVEN